MTALYDRIGQQYSGTRAADPRIVGHLTRLLALPPQAVLCDVGAGSGNYTDALAERGFVLHAVEPSKVMREQARKRGNVTWLEGTAEHLPLPDGCVDGIVCTLAIHHFQNLADAASEMQRVCPHGTFVFFTMDSRTGDRTWFEEDFPEIRTSDFVLFSPLSHIIQAIEGVTRRVGEIHEFPLLNDLIDNFMYAPWGRPEVYLDPTFRANTSGFASADPEIVRQRLKELSQDLAAGVWDARYGYLRTRNVFDAGFRFLTFRNAALS